MAAKLTWIEAELHRLRGVAQLDDTARELVFQKAAQSTWEQLMRDARADVEEFNRSGNEVEFTETSPLGFHVTRAAVELVVAADLANHSIRYDYHSEKAEASPEGGIFSLRLSRYGRVHLYSADERLSAEEARRMLLEPVLFPENISPLEPSTK